MVLTQPRSIRSFCRDMPVFFNPMGCFETMAPSWLSSMLESGSRSEYTAGWFNKFRS